MRPKPLLPILVAVLVAAASVCTGTAAPVDSRSSASVFLPTPSASDGPATAGPEPILLDVVATTSRDRGEEDASYLDGMRLAVQEVNASGGVRGRPLGLAVHDDGGDVGSATALVGDLLDEGATAILSVGPGTSLSALRASFATAGTPAILLAGDLYTSRELFPQVFQTTIPWEWQANVIARYVVTDREAKDVVFIGTGPGAGDARRALRAALGYWGGSLAAGFTDTARDPQTGFAGAFARAARADWAVVFGSPADSMELVNAIGEVAPRSLGITGPSDLLIDESGLARPESGTSACYMYTWAGWAEPVPRVATFRQDLEASAGQLPSGLEQEGYDAVRVLASALRETGGRGGPRLRSALEDVRGRTYSGFPIELGPDDHVFPPRDEIGLFAVAGPREKLDPWQEPGSQPWRAIMRTFTYDGRRTSVLNTDRRIFFPFWNKNLPGPNYFRSRYGIATRPGDDPLH